MKKELEFQLTRPAKSKGGDRYEFGEKGMDMWMTIYVPQEISRAGGMPFPKLKVTIEAV